MDKSVIIEKLREHEAELKAARIVRLSVFGSVARGDATEDSDLDLIVRFDEGRSLLDHGGVVMDLRDLLGVKVDVMDEDGIRERFRKEAMKEAVAL